MSVKTTQRTALTDREAQIFSLIGHGKSSKEIAADLAISAATVATHRKHICAKLGLHSTAELASRAVGYPKQGIAEAFASNHTVA